MTVDPTKIKAQGIDLATTISSDSGNVLTTDSGDLLKVPTTSTVASAGTTPITNGGVYTALGNRTAIVTDNAPTSGSSNFLTSGSVYTAIQNAVSSSVVTLVHHEAVSGTVDGSNVIFTIPDTPLNNKVDVIVGKAAYIQGIDYSVSGTTITFTTAPTLLVDGTAPSIRATYWKQANVSSNPPSPSLAYIDASDYTPTYTADPTAWDGVPTENSTKPVISGGVYETGQKRYTATVTGKATFNRIGNTVMVQTDGNYNGIGVTITTWHQTDICDIPAGFTPATFCNRYLTQNRVISGLQLEATTAGKLRIGNYTGSDITVASGNEIRVQTMTWLTTDAFPTSS